MRVLNFIKLGTRAHNGIFFHHHLTFKLVFVYPTSSTFVHIPNMHRFTPYEVPVKDLPLSDRSLRTSTIRRARRNDEDAVLAPMPGPVRRSGVPAAVRTGAPAPGPVASASGHARASSAGLARAAQQMAMASASARIRLPVGRNAPAAVASGSGKGKEPVRRSPIKNKVPPTPIVIPDEDEEDDDDDMNVEEEELHTEEEELRVQQGILAKYKNEAVSSIIIMNSFHDADLSIPQGRGRPASPLEHTNSSRPAWLAAS